MPDSTFLPGDEVDLRPIEEDDLDYLRDTINDPEVWRPIGGSRPINRKQEQEFFDNVVCGDDGVHLLITADGSPVGTIGLREIDWETGCGEIGYWIDPDEHGQGYGTEATELMVEYAFDQLGLHRIEAHVFEFNEASQRLLESIGFAREGTSRESQFIDGEHWDTYWYGLLEEEWRD